MALTTSITPRRSSSPPRGSATGQALAPSLARISSTVRSKSAPTRSILLTKASRGTRYLSAWRQTVSDWGWTPATPQKTATAPSSTRMERSTSAVKSTWPGVSMMLMRKRSPSKPLKVPSRCWLQKQVIAAEVMVIPRSFSCSIQSVTVFPSWTSPMRWIRPEQ